MFACVWANGTFAKKKMDASTTTAFSYRFTHACAELHYWLSRAIFTFKRAPRWRTSRVMGPYGIWTVNALPGMREHERKVVETAIWCFTEKLFVSLVSGSFVSVVANRRNIDVPSSRNSVTLPALLKSADDATLSASSDSLEWRQWVTSMTSHMIWRF